MEFQIEKIDFFAREIEKNIVDILEQRASVGKKLWDFLHNIHPAEAALILNETADSCVFSLLEKMDAERAMDIFSKLSISVQAHLVPLLDIKRLSFFFRNIPSDQLADLLENVSDKDLEKYLKLTFRRRAKILLSLQAEDKSAGRILNSDVLVFHKELTVKKVTSLLQQLDKKYEVLLRQYVVNADSKLVGFIEIVDLLKNSSNTKIAEIMKPIEIKINVGMDQEEVADIFKHYDLFSVPVTDAQDHFLGVITSNDVIDIIEEESTEASYKMSGVTGIEHTYVNVDFWKIIYERCKWLVPLLLLQSVSSFITNHFQEVLNTFSLVGFLTMLVGTGGNVGNQSVTFFVRGLATGEINRKNKSYVVLREIAIALIIGLVLIAFAFFRIRLFSNHYPSIFVVILSLFAITVTSVLLGTLTPVILDHWKIDPAHSAAPFIATCMDIIGVTLYCLIAMFFLGS